MGEEGEEESREEAEEGQEGEEGQEAEEEKEEEGQEAEEEEKEEEKEEGSLPGRQAQEGPAQEQGFGRGWQEECGEAEGCGQGPLQGSHVQRRADRHHGQEQDDLPGDCQGGLGLHQVEEAEQQAHDQPGRRAGQGHWRQDVDVQDEQGALQAREVSAHLCVKSRSLTRAGPLFGDLLQAPGPWGSSASQARHSCSLLSAGYSICEK